VKHITQEVCRLAILECLLEAEDEFGERADRSSGAASRTASKEHFNGGPECCVVCFGEIAEGIKRGLADAARGNVEDAQEGDVGLGMHGETDVGERVFHFGAIVKAETANKFVAQATATEEFFKSTRLKVCAVFDSACLIEIVVEDFLQFASDEFGFGLRVARFEIAEIFSGGRFGFERFAEAIWIVFYDGPGCVQNILRGAIISFEADDARGGKIPRKTEKDGNVRPAPAVDGLVFVADDTNVLLWTGEQSEEIVLDT